MTHNIEKRINKLKTSGNPKFKKLDSDIHYLLKRFEGEKNHKGFYPKFKQGEIVFVDFGINVNKEFSNSHFAIVMNKNDSNTEDIVNVIPLSSKENKKYLKMNFDLKWEYYLRLFLNLISAQNNSAILKEVFDKKYQKNNTEFITKDYFSEFISDSLEIENKLKVRFISETKVANAKKVKADFEDAYMYFLKKQQGGLNHASIYNGI